MKNRSETWTQQYKQASHARRLYHLRNQRFNVLPLKMMSRPECIRRNVEGKDHIAINAVFALLII